MAINPKAILFDLDNTLIDRDSAYRRVAEGLYETLIAPHATYVRDEACSLLVSWDNDGFADRTWLAETMLETWPAIPASITNIAKLERQLMWTSVQLEVRVTSFLLMLNEVGMAWGIVTNGDSASQRAKIKSTGLEEIAPFVVISEEFGHSKPEPAIFEEALRRLGNPLPEETLFVGDRPDSDIGGAQGVGLKTAWVRRDRSFPRGRRKPDYEIDHVDELRTLLDGLV